MQDQGNNNQNGQSNPAPFAPTSGSGSTAAPGFNPMNGSAQVPPTGAPATPPEDTTPANFQLGALLPAKLDVPIQAHELSFDEDKFIRLLAGSISLSRDEKKRIIDTIPKLKQSQIDELIRIFEEEKMKFSQLSKKHVPQLEKLAKQHAQDWQDLEASYRSEQKKADDQAAADEIRKSLGI